MKRLLLLPVLLILALASRAQEGEEIAPPEGEQAQNEAPPEQPAGDAPVSEESAPNGDASDAAPEASEQGQGEEPVKEEPVISIKPTAAYQDEGEGEEETTDAPPPRKPVASTTVSKPVKKAKKPMKGAKSAKSAKGKKAAPAAVKTKAPVLAAAAPPPPPLIVSAVPLTPITPRNP